VYFHRSEDEEGVERFMHQFSFPGGIGSHATPETPGSIHEGGELGYSISHAFGAVFDSPNLIALTMVVMARLRLALWQPAGTATSEIWSSKNLLTIQ